MSPKFSECDFDSEVFTALQEHSFFPYSGEDGDLFRKHGLAGWRISVYGRYLVKIQKKGRRFKGRRVWNTKRCWEVDPEEELSDEQIAEFKATLAHLVEHGELPDE